jgi:tetratricopeptide (TPR) repeat protein
MKLKIVIASVAALVVIALFTYTPPRSLEQPPEQISSHEAKQTTRPRVTAPRLPAASETVEPQTELMQPTNLIGRFLKSGDSPQLSLEQAEAYLQQNRRQVENLLAAWRVTGDRIFMQEAMEKYPNDPRVAFSAACLYNSYGSEEEAAKGRRHWLDTFKQSAPDNALANYLSAREHFKSGQNDQAVHEMLSAANKPIQDYALDFIQNSEEAYRSAGYSDAEAKAIATSYLLLPQLTEFKQVGLSLVDLAKAYRQAGDEASAQATLQMASNFGQQIDGSGTLTLIQSIVGIAVQQNVLKAMDPNSPFGDSGQTVQNQIDALNQRRASLKDLTAQAQAVLPTLSEPDLNTYFDRLKLFGEVLTMRWAVSRFGQH